MKANEHSDKKNGVSFDESMNVVKEFRKGDRIAKDNEIKILQKIMVITNICRTSF